MGKEIIFVVAAIVAGVAVAGSLFLLYPDLMFQNTSFESQGGAATDEPVFINPTDTAGTSNSTNSTTGAPATTAPPY